MTQIAQLLFDLDGTLIDSSDGVVAAINGSLADHGVAPRPANELAPYIGYPLKDVYRNYVDASFESLYTSFRRHAETTVVAAAQPLPGADEALREVVARGWPIALVTTKSREHVDGILHKLGWNVMFQATVTSDDVADVKPHPEALASAAKQLPSDVVATAMIGDTVNDIMPAQALGMTTIAVASPYGRHERVKALHPDYWINEISDLIGILPYRREVTP